MLEPGGCLEHPHAVITHQGRVVGVRIAALENVPVGRRRCLIRNIAQDRGAGRSKPLAKRASQRAVASERLAVTRCLRQCWHSSGGHSGCCGSQDKVLRSLSPYLLQPSLNCSQVAVAINAKISRLEMVEQLSRGSPRLGVEPVLDLDVRFVKAYSVHDLPDRTG